KICPVCNKPLTVGVMQRVEDLAGRGNDDLGLTINEGITKSESFPKRAGFRMLVQLEEIIAESMGMTVNSQKVKAEYIRLVTTLAPELHILTKLSLEEIEKKGGKKLAEGIKKVRERNI